MHGIEQNTRSVSLRPYRVGKATFDFSARTYVMGILNVTPDSFSDGGRFLKPERAVAHALQMIDEGADMIDVGGESTRPRGAVYGSGASALEADEELRRVIPVIEQLSGRTDVPLSVDTWKSRVAAEAIAAGAVMVNDISGFTFDDAMAATVGSRNAAAVLMHTPAPPWAMPEHVAYDDVVEDVRKSLEASVQRGLRAGVDQMFIDPGFGFGKSFRENFRILARLDRFSSLLYPVVVGISRKSFIGKVLDLPVESRLEGSLAALTAAILHGANVVRVHDVKESRRAAAVADELVRAL